MRSLFAKIFSWFLLTLIVTILVTITVSILSYNPNSKVHTFFSLLLRLGLEDARHGWETGGHDGLRDALNRFQDSIGAPMVYFTDGNGNDLLTGEARPDLIRAAKTWPIVRFLRLTDDMAFNIGSQDGKYHFFIVMTPTRAIASTAQAIHLVVLGVIALLCYMLTYHLTAPLRALRSVVEGFGQGDFHARAEDRRRDEMGELARAFNRMADQIETLLAAERRLLLDISHELRSPLARLGVAVELARSGQAPALPLDRIQKEADRLNDLIDQLLQVTRLESQTQRHREPVRLDELVRDIVNDCAIEASAQGCALVYPIPANVVVNGDPELLRRAIENVMRNAIRYAPSESKVEVAVEHGSEAARIRVRDHGPGVPDEALPHLFEPFYRVDSDRDRRSGGVGLGLSIVRRAVELHHGKVHAANVHPGLQVEIELPA